MKWFEITLLVKAPEWTDKMTVRLRSSREAEAKKRIHEEIKFLPLNLWGRPGLMEIPHGTSFEILDSKEC